MILKYQLTPSTEELEAGSWDNQLILLISWNLKAHYVFIKIPQLDPVLKQVNQVLTGPSCFSKTHFKYRSPTSGRVFQVTLPNYLFTSSFQSNILYTCLSSYMSDKCPNYRIRLDVITLMSSSYDSKLWIFEFWKVFISLFHAKAKLF
jgi:hypothetical protein